MPIYEYQCAECNRIFEEIVFGDKVVPCPQCGCVKTDKLISRTQRHRTGGAGQDYAQASSGAGAARGAGGAGGGGCAGCAGGSCSSCG